MRRRRHGGTDWRSFGFHLFLNFPHSLGSMSPTPRSYLVPFSEYYCMQRPFPLYWTPVLRQRSRNASRAPCQILIQAPVKKARAKKRLSRLMCLKTYLVDNNVCFGHASWFLSSHECHDIGLGVKINFATWKDVSISTSPRMPHNFVACLHHSKNHNFDN